LPQLLRGAQSIVGFTLPATYVGPPALPLDMVAVD
jgi:hypothetical protein